MGEFFRGWKRKLGCVTLAMACVFTGGLLRSLDTHDEFAIETGLNLRIVVESQQQYFELWCKSLTNGEYRANSSNPFSWEQRSWDPSMALYEYLERVPDHRFFRAFGIGIYGSKTSSYKGITISYVNLIITLTFISAWLLLSKPRRRQTSIEPVAETAA